MGLVLKGLEKVNSFIFHKGLQFLAGVILLIRKAGLLVIHAENKIFLKKVST